MSQLYDKRGKSMSFLIKYVDYDATRHTLKVTAHHLEKSEDAIFLTRGAASRKPAWLTDTEYQGCLYLFECLDAIRSGMYTIHYGDYFKKNDLKLVAFTLESAVISVQITNLEYLFVGKSFGAVRFKDIPSLMVNIPYFKVLEPFFLKESPHRLRLLT